MSSYSPSSPAIIEATSLQLSRGGRRLLDNVAAGINTGSLTLVLGHNGAGKSLFLWCLHRLIEPDSGRIDGPPQHQQKMVFQKPVMLRRSARDHFNFLCPGLDVTTVQSWFTKAQLQHRIDSPARQLSGGEAQKLALIGALASQPQLLFLDEPTAHLDFEATRFFETQIKDAHAAGTTIIMISHNRAQAERLADHILFMDHGQIVESAPADQFFAAPTSAPAKIYLDHN